MKSMPCFGILVLMTMQARATAFIGDPNCRGRKLTCDREQATAHTPTEPVDMCSPKPPTPPHTRCTPYLYRC